MLKLLLFVWTIAVSFSALGQNMVSVCDSLNQLNTAILLGTLKTEDSAKQFRHLIAELKNHKTATSEHTWVFPLRGYAANAIGGNQGNGYSDKGYQYLDGNRHVAHPAHDIFISDKDQDGLDDHTHKPIAVQAVDNGIVIACSNTWQPGSKLRGGKYIWIYHQQSNLITYYAHNSSVFVKPGDRVSQGQKIAEVGRTGFNAFQKRSPTHLHFSAFYLLNNLPVPFNCYKQLLHSKSI